MTWSTKHKVMVALILKEQHQVNTKMNNVDDLRKKESIVDIMDTNNLKIEEFESEPQYELKSKKETKKTRSSIIVTGGALAMTLLAAALVTSTFLLSPIIEQIFGKEGTQEAKNSNQLMYLILVKKKNNDSVKEAPAYCRIFIKLKRGEGDKNSLFKCFVVFCNVL